MVGSPHFGDAALVVLGHGSAQHPEAGRPVFDHAAALRRRGTFAVVHEAFWKQAPQIASVLRELPHPRVFIVPLFISEGYFSNDIIPRALGFPPFQTAEDRVRVVAGRYWHFCQPIGSHPRMTALLLARARETLYARLAARRPRLRDVTLFVAGHGTTRDPNSRRVIEQQAERIRRAGRFAAVRAVFLEESPRIADCPALAHTPHVLVVPFFLGEGMHWAEDIPVLLGHSPEAVRQRLQVGKPPWQNPTRWRDKWIWYGRPVGTHPGVADIILSRVREAARHEHRRAAKSRSEGATARPPGA